jgi:hypothetical protein
MVSVVETTMTADGLQLAALTDAAQKYSGAVSREPPSVSQRTRAALTHVHHPPTITVMDPETGPDVIGGRELRRVPVRPGAGVVRGRICAAAILIGFCLAGSTAQAALGVRVGAAVSGLRSSDKDFRPYLGYEVEMLQQVGNPEYGPQVGVWWDIPLLGFLTARPELGFVQRGYHLDQIPLYNSSYKIRISYLELPALLRAGLTRGRVRPGLLLGPYAAYRLDAVGRLMDHGDVDTRRLSTVSGFDYGLVTGLDTDVIVGAGRLLLDLRLNWGLADVMREADGFTPLHDTPGRVQVLSLAFSTGYGF